ncbi:MAG: LamB/YcsF family protein [Nitrososphaerota archaeon]|nr:LamB/YcsF family protein [Nitrososphaerota archaeon]
MKSVDINCDMGEGFSAYRAGEDEEMVKYVTSASLACGFHGGDPQVMSRAVALCRGNGVSIGAHPSFPDLQGFGRREMVMPKEELVALLVYQVGALEALARVQGAEVYHVKPHGALYNMACTVQDYAEAVAQAAGLLEKVLIAPCGSRMRAAAESARVRVACEGFADRGYLSDGRLAPRAAPGGLVTDPERAAENALKMVDGGRARTLDGGEVEIRVDTVCIHGDTPGAPAIARTVRRRLEEAGVKVRSLREIP